MERPLKERSMTNAFAFPRLRRDRVPHVVAAGTAWGLTVAVGFIAMDVISCGAVCIDQSAITTALCVAVGIIGIGPFAALHQDQRNGRRQTV
jgi:hypothetical protein